MPVVFKIHVIKTEGVVVKESDWNGLFVLESLNYVTTARCCDGTTPRAVYALYPSPWVPCFMSLL